MVEPKGDLTQEEIEKLTIDDIKKRLGTVLTDETWFKLYSRLYQLQEEAVMIQIPEGGLNALDLKTIIRLEEEAPASSGIHQELQEKRKDMQAALVQGIPGGVEALTDIDKIIDLMREAGPNYSDLWKSLDKRLDDITKRKQLLTPDQISKLKQVKAFAADQALVRKWRNVTDGFARRRLKDFLEATAELKVMRSCGVCNQVAAVSEEEEEEA